MSTEETEEKLPTIGDLLRAKGRGSLHNGQVCRLYIPGEDDSYTCASFSDVVNCKLPSTDENDGELYFTPTALSGSDYSGSGTLGRSNFRVFEAEHGSKDGVVELSGGYGSYGFAIRLDCSDTEIIETLQSLEDYPVLSDDDLSELEMTESNEAWDSWAAREFRDKIRKIHGIDISEVSDDNLRHPFEEWRESANQYWECDGDSMWIDMERIAESINPSDILKKLHPFGAVEEEDAEEIRTESERKRTEKSHLGYLTNSRLGGHSFRLKFERRHGHPAASIALCEVCHRSGWINIHPVDGAPDYGGTLFSESCKLGVNPRTHCTDCGRAHTESAGESCTLKYVHNPARD